MNDLPMEEETVTYIKLVVMSCPYLRRLEVRRNQMDDMATWLRENMRHVDI